MLRMQRRAGRRTVSYLGYNMICNMGRSFSLGAGRDMRRPRGQLAACWRILTGLACSGRQRHAKY